MFTLKAFIAALNRLVNAINVLAERFETAARRLEAYDAEQEQLPETEPREEVAHRKNGKPARV